MSIRTIFVLSAVIVLSAAATASAATKKQKGPRSGQQSQAIAPRTAPTFNPYNPAATGGGPPGYNQMLERY
jgi:ABC-type oligopeptide transport system substrate-binding subunit